MRPSSASSAAVRQLGRAVGGVVGAADRRAAEGRDHVVARPGCPCGAIAEHGGDRVEWVWTMAPTSGRARMMSRWKRHSEEGCQRPFRRRRTRRSSGIATIVLRLQLLVGHAATA